MPDGGGGENDLNCSMPPPSSSSSWCRGHVDYDVVIETMVSIVDGARVAGVMMRDDWSPWRMTVRTDTISPIERRAIPPPPVPNVPSSPYQLLYSMVIAIVWPAMALVVVIVVASIRWPMMLQYWMQHVVPAQQRYQWMEVDL